LTENAGDRSMNLKKVRSWVSLELSDGRAYEERILHVQPSPDRLSSLGNQTQPIR
jgi:hypothetical protein